MIGWAVAVLLLLPAVAPPDSPEPDESLAEPIILPFETGWIRYMDAIAEDESRSCMADGEGAAFQRLAESICPASSAGASEAQHAKIHRLGMEAINRIVLAGEAARAAPFLTFGHLRSFEVDLTVSADGAVRSCRRVGGDTENPCDEFTSGEVRLQPFPGSADRRGRMTRLSGFCHAFDPTSCGGSQNDPAKGQ